MADLARPGANVTGVSGSVTRTLAPKRIELPREMLQAAQRIGVVSDRSDSNSQLDRAAIETAAQRLGLTLIVESMGTEADIPLVFARFQSARVDAVLDAASTISFNLRVPLCAEALRRKLPLVANRTEAAEAGVLLSYSSSQEEQLRRGLSSSTRFFEVQSRASPDRAAHCVRAGDQPAHGAGPRHRCAVVNPAARRPGAGVEPSAWLLMTT